MSDLIALAFKDKYRAEEVRGVLHQLAKDGVVQIDEAVVVVRDEAGQLQQTTGLDQTVPQLLGTAGGAGLGLLVGTVIAGPALLGAVAGGLAAHILRRYQPAMRTIRQFSATLTPGTSALFFAGQASDLDAAVARLQPYLADAIVLKADLPDELLAQIGSATTPAAEPEPVTAIKRLMVIINPAAGVERPILKPLNQVLRAAGISWDVVLTHASGDAQRHAAAAAAAGYDAVAIYGGDGTVMEVAGGLMGSGVPLAIIPGGSGNVMAIELGIPYDVRAAAALIAAETVQVRNIDLGRIGERFFALRAVTGYEAEYVVGTSREAKERMGNMAYALTAIQQDLRRIPFTLTLDGQTVEVEGFTCMVANSGNVGLARRPLLGNVSISDGLLDVIVVTNLNFLRLLSGAGAVVPEQHSMVQHWQVREVTVATAEPEVIVADGEVLGDTPFSVTVAPAAVRLIVP